jgi:hypothetical protein
MVKEGILPVKLEMGEEKVTARSGLVIFYEHMLSLGAIEEVKARFPFPGSGRGYGAEKYVVPLVLMLQGGGRSLEDLREIEFDVVLRELSGLKEMPRPCTVGDWLRRMGDTGVRAVGMVSRGVVRKVLKADKGEEYTLDIDATVIEAEKEDAEWSYKKVKGYQPMLGYIAEVPVCLHSEFRAGNVPAGANMVAFLEACLKELPGGKRISYLRSDSAGYQGSVIDWCTEKGIRFSITADKDVAVMEAISLIAEEDWVSLVAPTGEETHREVAETVHTMNRGKESFRLVVQRWRNPQLDLFNPQQYCYQVIATDLECHKREVVWRHNGRGNNENQIKELKRGMGMERMPCGQHQANALLFAIGVLAYNCLPHDWRKKTVATLRWNLYQTAGKLIRHAEGVILRVMAPPDKFHIFLEIRKRSYALWQGG